VSGNMAVRSELLLRGLPWKSTKAHVSLWLLSHGFDAREVEIAMVDCRRRPSGRAIVLCNSSQTAMKAALALHLQRFEGRYIEAYVHTDVDRVFGAFSLERSRQAHEESAAAGVCSATCKPATSAGTSCLKKISITTR
jgi:hypothetical protein